MVFIFNQWAGEFAPSAGVWLPHHKYNSLIHPVILLMRNWRQLKAGLAWWIRELCCGADSPSEHATARSSTSLQRVHGYKRESGPDGAHQAFPALEWSALLDLIHRPCFDCLRLRALGLSAWKLMGSSLVWQQKVKPCVLESCMLMPSVFSCFRSFTLSHKFCFTNAFL